MTKIEFAAAIDVEKYLLRENREVLSVLTAIAKSRNLVTVQFGDADEFLLSRVLAVSDAERVVILDYGSHESANQRLLASGRVEVATTHDGVRVQFDANNVEKVVHEGRPALRVPFPEMLLRLQRREFYRLTAPAANPLKCMVPIKGTPVETQILDISIGGVGLLCYATDVDLVTGARYAGARIDLPDFGPVAVTLEIRNTFEVTLKNGLKTMRSGCQFLELPSSVEQAVQRYILRSERERRARAIL